MNRNAVTAVAVALTMNSARAAEQRPNIVLIVADDLGYGELGCYGQTRIKTPNLDRMAARGLRFTRFYAGAPVCAPSRCCLITGCQPSRAVIRDNVEVPPEGQMALPARTMTISRALRAAGYTTAMVGKWGLGAPGSEGAPERQGFDHFYGYLCQREAHNYYPTHLWRDGKKVILEGNTPGNVTGRQYAHDLMTEDVLSWVGRKRTKPFFLCWTPTIPHLALQVPEDSITPYRGLWDEHPYDGKGGYQPQATPRAAYAAMISRLDRDVGRLVDRLRELGLEQNTLILFTSDNGPTFKVGGADAEFFHSAGPLRGLKGSVYEGGIRVPLIAYRPGAIPAGRTSDHIAAFWDVFPTLLDVAGGARPAGLDGLSFAPTLTGIGDQPEHGYLFWEFPGYGGQQAVLMQRWKGVRREMDKGNMGVALYDLDTDIAETTDVASAHPDIVARIEEIMRRDRVPSPIFPQSGLDKAPS
ncbi:MAG TPA: arylsulfatase [Armatimonadota bacterium]|jgi:arylsulfatase